MNEFEISRRVLILGIWMIAALASAFTRDSQCIGAALMFTIFYGCWIAIRD